ncbi:MAG: nitroreductase family protein [Peptococcaceae bacterium]|nr:nitroreductase family protein [Peptococcaceae bacterium]
MARVFDYNILPEIKERWSARAIEGTEVSDEEIMTLLEAARYAPSCFNEQPWRFIVAKDKGALDKMRGVLTPSNRVWANNAPVLILIGSKKTFSRNSKENYWHMFDAGTAWGYLSLQAQKLGLVAHAMGGFSISEARKAFNIPEDLDIMTIVAVGKYGRKESLNEELQKREQPDVRMEISELIIKTDKEGA